MTPRMWYIHCPAKAKSRNYTYGGNWVSDTMMFSYALCIYFNGYIVIIHYLTLNNCVFNKSNRDKYFRQRTVTTNMNQIKSRIYIRRFAWKRCDVICQLRRFGWNSCVVTVDCLSKLNTVTTGQLEYYVYCLSCVNILPFPCELDMLDEPNAISFRVCLTHSRHTFHAFPTPDSP